MLKISKLFKKKSKIFCKNIFSEKLENISNPNRGWYNVFHLDLTDEFNFENILEKTNEKDTLILLLINISSKKGKPLDESDFEKIISLIKSIKLHGKNVILRLAYDSEGRAMENEPTLFSQVLQHADDVGRLLNLLSEEVFVYQGLLIGKWGEMHSSRYVIPEKMKDIYKIISSYDTKGVFFAVRCPYHWRLLFSSPNMADSCNMGLFDDAIFGSESDLGTFSDISKNRAGWNHAWVKSEEIEFEENLCVFVPNGGEVLYNESYCKEHKALDMVKDLADMHISYLNRSYDLNILNVWKNEIWMERDCWNGKSVFEYIGAHLGYRFYVSDCACNKGDYGYELQICIENQGFSNVYKELTGYISIESYNGETQEITINFDFRKINSNQKKTIRVLLPDIFRLNGDVYLFIKQKQNDETIYLANNGCDKDGKLLLGRLTIC